MFFRKAGNLLEKALVLDIVDEMPLAAKMS